MNYGKDLMYVYIWKPLHQYCNNLMYIILTLEHTFYQVYINYALEGKAIIPNYDKIDDNQQIIVPEPAYEQCKGSLGTIPIDNSKAKFKTTTHPESNIMCLPWRRYFKS